MAEKTDIPAGYKLCEATGYLESLDGQGIQPKHKSAFLKAFKKSGDKTKKKLVETGFALAALKIAASLVRPAIVELVKNLLCAANHFGNFFEGSQRRLV